jgi:hypothetical protein
MSTPVHMEPFENLLAHVKESTRLKQASDLDLIRECMRSEVSDDPIVIELMNRVRPGWLEEL